MLVDRSTGYDHLGKECYDEYGRAGRVIDATQLSVVIEYEAPLWKFTWRRWLRYTWRRWEDDVFLLGILGAVGFFCFLLMIIGTMLPEARFK